MKYKLVVFDFDGVFADKIYVSDSGVITKSYNSKDSYALKLLKDTGIKIGIITGCDTNVLDHMNKIISRIDLISKNTYNKFDKIKEWCDLFNIKLSEVAYIGDDVFDAIFMKEIGFSACPADAVTECLQNASYICKNKGGTGAVREFVEKIIAMNSNRLYTQNNSKYCNIERIIIIILVIIISIMSCKFM